MSRGSIEQLLRVYKQQCRREMVELKAQQDELGQELYDEARQHLLEATLCPGIQEAVKAMQTMEGMVATLHYCCDEIESQAQAREILDTMPNVLDLFTAISSGLQEDLEAAKNSTHLGPTKKAAKKSAP